jgi:hypothetical protein
MSDLNVLVFDTSAYLNGRRDHYPPKTFPSVWDVVGAAMTDGRIIAPREVYRELVAKDDDIMEWCKQLPTHVFVDPIEPVQRRVGAVYARFPTQDGETEQILLSSLKPSTASSRS